MIRFVCEYDIVREVFEANSYEEMWEKWMCILATRVEVLNIGDVRIRPQEHSDLE
jgi:hypothetical protein